MKRNYKFNQFNYFEFTTNGLVERPFKSMKEFELGYCHYIARCKIDAFLKKMDIIRGYYSTHILDGNKNDTKVL